MTNLNEISKQVYEANKLKGFDVKKENIGQTLCLIHSEISEALEAIRKDKKANMNGYNAMKWSNVDETGVNAIQNFKDSFNYCIKDTFEDEIADTFIRLFDLVGFLGIDIDKHIELKMKFNATREHKHGKAY